MLADSVEASARALKKHDAETLDQHVDTLEAIFEKKGSPIQFKVKVTPGGDNAVYTRKEKGRNPNFSARQITVGLADDKSVLLEESVYLTAAGGDEYTIEAKDAGGNVVKAPFQLATRRKVYYQIIKMTGMNALSSHSFLTNKLWDTGKKFYIKAVPISSKGDATHIENVDDVPAQKSAMKAAGHAQYNNDNYPYCFAILYVDSLAAHSRKTNNTAPMSNGGGPQTVSFSKELWEGVDSPTGSANKDWYVSVEFMGTTPPTALSVNDVRMMNRTTVSVSDANIPAGKTGPVRVTVKVIDRWRGGLSFSDCNLVVCATRAFVPRQSLGASLLEAIILHEVGHKIGMVPDGNGALARQSNCDDTTFVGPHCADSGCVMYGQADASRNAFCSICEKSVRKLDETGANLIGFNTLF